MINDRIIDGISIREYHGKKITYQELLIKIELKTP